MGKAHLWRSAQSAPSLRANGGRRLSVKRIKAVTSCPVCECVRNGRTAVWSVYNSFFCFCSWTEFHICGVPEFSLSAAILMCIGSWLFILFHRQFYDQTILLIAIPYFSCPLSSVSQKTLRALRTYFPVLLISQHRYSTGVQYDGLWFTVFVIQCQIRPGMSKHHLFNSFQQLARCSSILFNFGEYFQGQNMLNPSPKYENCGKRRRKLPVNKKKDTVARPTQTLRFTSQT